MRKIFVVAILLLAACGKESDTIRACSELSGSVNAESFCLAQFECEPGMPQFRGHMCLCQEELCLCFINRSKQFCDTPTASECGIESSMLIVEPGMCGRDAQPREIFLGGEYDRLLGSGWYDKALEGES